MWNNVKEVLIIVILVVLCLLVIDKLGPGFSCNAATSTHSK